MAYGEAERAAAPTQQKKPNNLTLEGRRKLTVTGVEEVERFDETEIALRTGEGRLVIAGEGLHVSRLSVDSGDVNVTGRIGELRYEEAAPERGSFWTRLWR